MTRRQLEVERTYDVPDDLALPDLPGLDARIEERQLEAVYWDTADLRLRRGRATLRSRTGGPDAGWHLKLPSGADREEVQADGLPDDAVPPALLDAASGLLRGAPLVPLVRLRTARTVRLVRGPGDALVEVVDDRVEAQGLRVPDAPVQHWREWEVELVAGHRDVLDVVEEQLLATGAVPAAVPSKLGRAVPLPPPLDRSWRTAGTAGALLADVLRQQVDVLLAVHAPLRVGAPGALHRAEVAARRLDGVLAVARPLLDRELTDALRPRVRELADVLGGVARSADLAERLHADLAAEDPALVLGPVRDVLDEVLASDRREHGTRLLAALEDLALLDALDALADDPPFGERAQRPVGKELRRLLRRAGRRLGAAGDDATGLRRRAAALRDLARTSRGAVRGAGRLARRARDLQHALDERQQAAAAQDVLRRTAALCARAGRNGFTLGRLHALEQVQEDDVAQSLPALVRRAVRALP